MKIKHSNWKMSILYNVIILEIDLKTFLKIFIMIVFLAINLKSSAMKTN